MDHSQLLKRYEVVVQLLEDMNCGFVIRDADGIVSAINRRFLGWLGYARYEIEGQPLIKIVPEDIREVNLEAMHETEQGDNRARLTAVQRKDGSTFPVLVLANRILDSSGDYAGSCSMIIEMGTVQTAKFVGEPRDVHMTLERIAVELRAISLSAASTASVVNLRHPMLEELSNREREVLARLMDGDRVPSIAGTLHISPHTVRNHLKSIFRKLGVSSQASLIEKVRAL